MRESPMSMTLFICAVAVLVTALQIDARARGVYHGCTSMAFMVDSVPGVAFSLAPKRLELIPIGDSLRIYGTVVDTAVLSVALTLDSNGVLLAERNWTIADSGPEFRFVRGIPSAHQHQYRVVVTAARSGDIDTVLHADSIVYGMVFALSGQSNAVAGDTTALKHPLARTFGVHFSTDPADTAWSLSDPTYHEGGSTVGALGMQIQRHLAEQNIPSALINGGVTASGIQNHLPYEHGIETLSTIYGMFAYRRRVARVNKYINWMIWYQGESNNGLEDYALMFDSLYRQWHVEMPNLKHIIVVQIRPGCGNYFHAQLRERQRGLQKTYQDVMVIAAAAVPYHNNCHFYGRGYAALGDLMARQFDASGFDGSGPLAPEWTSPDVSRIAYLDRKKTKVRLKFRGHADYVPTLFMENEVSVRDTMRTSDLSFFGDADEARTPLEVKVHGDVVDLTFALPVSTISYVPDHAYTGSSIIFQGPWIVNENGVGALTFYNIRVDTTELEEEDTSVVSNPDRLVSIGDRIIVMHPDLASEGSDNSVSICDIHGAEVFTTSLVNDMFVVPHLAAAPYFVRAAGETFIIIVL